MKRLLKALESTMVTVAFAEHGITAPSYPEQELAPLSCDPRAIA